MKKKRKWTVEDDLGIGQSAEEKNFYEKEKDSSSNSWVGSTTQQRVLGLQRQGDRKRGGAQALCM